MFGGPSCTHTNKGGPCAVYSCIHQEVAGAAAATRAVGAAGVNERAGVRGATGQALRGLDSCGGSILNCVGMLNYTKCQNKVHCEVRIIFRYL